MLKFIIKVILNFIYIVGGIGVISWFCVAFWKTITGKSGRLPWL